ncbi:hypothetical protein E8P82_14640 [Arthrobacter echini]|uniref:Uncharacterized protein n=1 Tax=Arthrobacter echini TaxID=1529066 RepID=A0A4S5DZZ1_9MICC|nr:hypothetical protein [Arthrobacter echini]THJ64606.1 hypothetical protein E8P82_14640 [Arthrobacter echini]
MTTLLIVLNLLASVISFSAIVWAWHKARAKLRDSEARFDHLKEFGQSYGGEQLTYDDVQHLRELVNKTIHGHMLDGLGLQVGLVGLGIALGTAANVLPLVTSG